MTIAQDAIVTLVMLGALWLVVRRLVGFATTGQTAPKCASCESGTCAPAPAAAAAPDDRAAGHPLVFIRSAR